MADTSERLLVSEGSLVAAIVLLCITIVMLAAPVIGQWEFRDIPHFRYSSFLVSAIYYGGLA